MQKYTIALMFEFGGKGERNFFLRFKVYELFGGLLNPGKFSLTVKLLFLTLFMK